MLGLVIIARLTYYRYKPKQANPIQRPKPRFLIWHGLKFRVDTDPVVQHLLGHARKRSWGASPLAAGFVFPKEII